MKKSVLGNEVMGLLMGVWVFIKWAMVFIPWVMNIIR